MQIKNKMSSSLVVLFNYLQWWSGTWPPKQRMSSWQGPTHQEVSGPYLYLPWGQFRLWLGGRCPPLSWSQYGWCHSVSATAALGRKDGECGKEPILLKSSSFISHLLILSVIYTECQHKGVIHGAATSVSQVLFSKALWTQRVWFSVRGQRHAANLPPLLGAGWPSPPLSFSLAYACVSQSGWPWCSGRGRGCSVSPSCKGSQACSLFSPLCPGCFPERHRPPGSGTWSPQLYLREAAGSGLLTGLCLATLPLGTTFATFVKCWPMCS